MPSPDMHVCYRGNPPPVHWNSDCLPQEAEGNVGCCKAGSAIIGEKLGRNGKQEMKGENKHSLPNSHTAVVPG